jgi:hypothetical protein
MPALFNVEAAVHKQIGDGFRVKVSILDFGMYINGMMVFPPNDEHEDWSVYTPAQRAGRGKYVYIVEFNKKMPLWAEVNDACIEAVKLELSFGGDDVSEAASRRIYSLDTVLKDIPDGPINLNDIEF